MTDTTELPPIEPFTTGPGRTDPVVRRSRWARLVWLVPAVALVLAIGFGIRGLVRRGPVVTVDVVAADGIKTGETRATYNGLEVGEVTDVAVAPDKQLIRLTLRLSPAMESLLRTGTRFWVVGSRPNLTDLSSLRATISGPSIGISPGPGRPARHFIGGDRGPALPPGTVGKLFHLVGPDVVSIGQGTSIYTHGWQVGTILGIESFGLDGFVVDAFVRAPYDRLVRTSTHFWDASAFQLTNGAGGLEARVTSPEIAAVGGVTFETPAQTANDPPAATDARFTLYPDSAEAATAPVGPEFRYSIRFDGAVGELLRGAPVKIEGFTIGRVIGTSIAFDPATGQLSTPVTIAIAPLRLHLPPARSAIDAVLRRLVAHGYRARLDQSPPVIGGRLVTLAVVKGAPPATIRPGSPDAWLPSSSAGDISDLTAKADSLLTKVDALPIAEIGRNLRGLTQNLDRLTASPQVKDSLAHLDSTLATLDRTMTETAPKIAPLVETLRRTADQAQATAAAANRMLGAGGGTQDGDLPSTLRQMNEAARSIRSMADYIGRHPEALVRGKQEQK
ncbi:MAG: intermembrane transport protein PqiB [Janthinobacterium lividum]